MALLGAINKVSGLVGTSLKLADTLFQKQVSIQNATDKDDVIVLNVIESETLTLSVVITDKPVADLGSASDYISRVSPPYELTGQISNRNLDLGDDPAEFLTQHVASLVPDVFNAINSAASLAGNFFDLGQDEIDRKLKTLQKWMLNGIAVTVLGARLDAAKLTPLNETFNFLIQDIIPVSNLDNGDNVGFTLRLKNLLNIQEPVSGTKKGSKLTDTITGALNLPNPF